MSEIGKNIKKIRLVKKMSQAEFASIFNLARPSIGAYEEGRSEPKVETIIQIAEYFQLSIDALLKRELTVNDLLGYGSFKEKLDKAHSQSLSNHPSGKPQKIVYKEKHLDYIVNYKNRDFIENLPSLSVPNIGKGKYRTFEVKGNEMLCNNKGIHEGDLMISRRVSENEIISDIVYVIITVDRIRVRRILEIGKNSLTLSADNPSIKDIVLNKEDIVELWKVVYCITDKFTPPKILEEKVQRLENELNKLSGDFKKFLKKT